MPIASYTSAPYLRLAPWLLLLLLGTAPMSCSQDPCEEGYNRHRDCLQGLDCKRVDPGMQASCQTEKDSYSVDYSIYKAVCQKTTGESCDCAGDERDRWDKYNSCQIEPAAICECR
jgi:hypothetical protein